jgi:hypothetical protein
MFWVAPIAGALVGALVYRFLAPPWDEATTEARPVEPVDEVLA